MRRWSTSSGARWRGRSARAAHRGAPRAGASSHTAQPRLAKYARGARSHQNATTASKRRSHPGLRGCAEPVAFSQGRKDGPGEALAACMRTRSLISCRARRGTSQRVEDVPIALRIKFEFTREVRAVGCVTFTHTRPECGAILRPLFTSPVARPSMPPLPRLPSHASSSSPTPLTHLACPPCPPGKSAEEPPNVLSELESASDRDEIGGTSALFRARLAGALSSDSGSG